MQSDGKMIIGGGFNTVDSAMRSNLVRLHTSQITAAKVRATSDASVGDHFDHFCLKRIGSG